MTVTSAPLRPARPVRRHVPLPPSILRLWWIEVRRSQMPLILPLIAALFWFDSYRPSTSQAPLYPLVTFWNMGQGHTIIDFGPFVAGMAAWIGSRDGRRRTADLVMATPRPRWVAQLTTWVATATWVVVAYLVFVGVMFAVYAAHGVQGEPPWWLVAVGAVAVVTFCAGGFVLGVLFPNRFIAPLAAFGGFLVMMMSSQTGFRDTSGWALLLPTNSNGNLQPDSGLLYPYLPDLPIARIMFLAGIAVAVLGLAGLPAAAGGHRLRVIAAAVTAAGVAVSGTAVGLASTATLGAHGIVIPALHDAASDNLITYTPVCAGSGFRVCLNPAYKRYLADTTAALTRAADQVAGLPGTPVRAVQSPAIYNSSDGQGGQQMTIGGNPPVLSVPLGAYDFLPGPTGFSSVPITSVSVFNQSTWLLFTQAFVGAGDGLGTPAQQAVRAAVLQDIGVPFSAQPKLLSGTGLMSGPPGQPPPPPGQATGPVYAAARRLAALPPATRHAWLATHLAALRDGSLTLKQVP